MNIEIIESQTQRNALADKIEVLEKVKALTLLTCTSRLKWSQITTRWTSKQ